MEGLISSASGFASHTAEFMRAAVAFNFVVGVILVLLGCIRFGLIANLLSWPVMSGFTSGAACIIIASQLPTIFGITVPKEDIFYRRIYRVGQYISTTHWPTLLFSAVCFVILWKGRAVKVRGYQLPKSTPLPLVLIAITILLSWSIGFEKIGIKTVGSVPSMLPAPSLPPLAGPAEFLKLLPNAAVMAIINYVQTISVGLVLGKQVGENIDPDQELMALGVSSLFGSCFSSFPACASWTRSAVQHQANPSTPMITVFTGVSVLIATVTLTPVFSFIPQSALSAVILAAAIHLISFDDFRLTFQNGIEDFIQLLVTLVVILVSDLTYGILAGVIMSLLLILYRTFTPRLTELGKLPGTSVWVFTGRYPQAVTIPNVVVLRFDGELNFSNTRPLMTTLTRLLQMHTRSQTLPLSPIPQPPHIQDDAHAGTSIELSEQVHDNMEPPASHSTPKRPAAAPADVPATAITTPKLVAAVTSRTNTPHRTPGFGPAIQQFDLAAAEGFAQLPKLSLPAEIRSATTDDVAKRSRTNTSTSVKGLVVVTSQCAEDGVFINNPVTQSMSGTSRTRLDDGSKGAKRVATTDEFAYTANTTSQVPPSTTLPSDDHYPAVVELGRIRATRASSAVGASDVFMPAAVAAINASSTANLRKRREVYAVASDTTNKHAGVLVNDHRHDDRDDNEVHTPFIGRADTEAPAAASADGASHHQAGSDRLNRFPSHAIADPENVKLRAVILDCIRVVAMDGTACKELIDTMRAYKRAGVPLLLAGVPGPVRDRIEKFLITYTKLSGSANRSASTQQPPSTASSSSLSAQQASGSVARTTSKRAANGSGAGMAEGDEEEENEEAMGIDAAALRLLSIESAIVYLEEVSACNSSTQTWKRMVSPGTHTTIQSTASPV
jgi:MFS superfamily sulfate permease-like transporter